MCFLVHQYENDDQAIETRHALHGVHWPISNRKALHVEFGKKEDMLKAQSESDAELATVTRTHQPRDSHIREIKESDDKIQKVCTFVLFNLQFKIFWLPTNYFYHIPQCFV